MNKKFLVGILTFLTICFLILGGLSFKSAKDCEGTVIQSGYYSNNTFVSTHSGTIGADQSKKEQYETWGITSFILSGLCGIVAIFVKIADKN